jgi:hypothetical protein
MALRALGAEDLLAAAGVTDRGLAQGSHGTAADHGRSRR